MIPQSNEPLHVQITPPSGTTTVPGDSTPAPACDGSAGPPRNLIPLYIAASNRYGLGELGPQTLAAINRIETDFGRLNQVTSTAGAVGWMQFMPATWDSYGVDADNDGKADPYNPKDAIHSAANYLAAAGAPENWYDAIWAYNHADWYVKDVQERASCYGTLESSKQTEQKLVTLTCEASEARALEIPNYYMRGFEDAASRYGLGRRGVWILAAVARLESDYGRGMTAKQLAETGPMGLSTSEWKRYGVDGDGDGLVRRDEPWDGIATFARMLWSKPTVGAGLFSHNHAAWYVEAVTGDADRISGKCKTAKAAWKIAYPRATTNATEINWDNLQVLNPSAARDIQNGLIDRRVLNLLAMLTQKYSLQLSSLRSDHSMMTASGNVSNHFGGRAMDIASVNGVSCTDQSASSPCTEVGLLLASLPDGIRPTELIYGWDLDGPGAAFALSDHQDHIHAGFGL
ncbi:MAG: lytic murein transglycosylase [Solirubrobacterales bacterium]|nr:lytic murein transglycosylase [Solirubrobacterales bacterium]